LLQERGERIVEGIDTPKEIIDVTIDVEEMMAEKEETGPAPSAIIPILPSERSVTAVKPTDLEMGEGDMKENLMQGEIMGKRQEIGRVQSVRILISLSAKSAIVAKLRGRKERDMADDEMNVDREEETKKGGNPVIGLAQSVRTQISPSVINATNVKQTNLVLILSPEIEGDLSVEIQDLLLAVQNAEEGDHRGVLADHVDLDSEALVEVAPRAIGQEEAAVDDESRPPQHSSCLNPSKPHGE